MVEDFAMTALREVRKAPPSVIMGGGMIGRRLLLCDLFDRDWGPPLDLTLKCRKRAKFRFQRKSP
jgi:hypothetical protein